MLYLKDLLNLTLISGLVSQTAFAFNLPAKPCSLHHGISEYVQPVADILGYQREDLSQYVKARHENLMDYSASGMLTCYDGGGGTGNAQLVTRKGKDVRTVLVTANHIFFNQSCQLADISKCYFVPLFAPSKKISVTLRPENMGKCGWAAADREDDWAVVTLNEPLNDIKIGSKKVQFHPLYVPDQPVVVKDGIKLTQVSTYEFNYPGTAGHAVDCISKDTNKIPGVVLTTTCSSGEGGSGSCEIQKKKSADGKIEHWLYSVMSGEPKGAVDHTPFSTGENANYTGDLFKHTNAVLDEAETQSTGN